MKSPVTCRQPGLALRGRRAGRERSPARRSAGVSCTEPARLKRGASLHPSLYPSIPSFAASAEPGRDAFSAAFLGGNLKVSPAPAPCPPWGFGGIAFHKPRRRARLSPARLSAPERSMGHAGHPGVPRCRAGARHPRLAEGGPAALRTDSALRDSLKAGWFILLRALLNGESERKSPMDFPVPLVSLLAPSKGTRMHAGSCRRARK